MDKPTFSKRVSGGTRIYYIDTHKDSKGSPYLAISEVPTNRTKGPKKRQRIFVHPEHLNEFQDAVNAAVEHIKIILNFIITERMTVEERNKVRSLYAELEKGLSLCHEDCISDALESMEDIFGEDFFKE